MEQPPNYPIGSIATHNTKALKAAAWVAVVGNALLALLKISIGFWAGSLAVVGDGIDSSSDVITSLITVWVASILNRPPSEKYPYGYSRADTIAAKALSFIIFFAGAQLFLSTLQNISNIQEENLPEWAAIYVTIFSIIAKLALARYQFIVGKRVGSAMLIANAKNMQNDVIISMAVLSGLALTIIFQMPILDAIAALLVSIWIMKVGFEIFMESNAELMDGAADSGLYQIIFQAVEEVEGAYNPHRTRIRKIGNLHVIDLDIEIDGNLTLHEAHSIGQTVENKIKAKMDNVYDIIIHFEPLGNIEKEEKFGLSHQYFKPNPSS